MTTRWFAIAASGRRRPTVSTVSIATGGQLLFKAIAKTCVVSSSARILFSAPWYLPRLRTVTARFDAMDPTKPKNAKTPAGLKQGAAMQKVAHRSAWFLTRLGAHHP